MSRVSLGICAFTHDSAAALIVDGELVGAVEEERLNGEKHTKSFPSLSIAWLLQSAGLDLGDITDVGYNYSSTLYDPAARDLDFPKSAHDAKRLKERAAGFRAVGEATRQRVASIGDLFPDAKVTAWRHHLTHARYAAEMMGPTGGAILVIDSIGELDSTTVWKTSAEEGEVYLDLCMQNSDPHSLGYVYATTTEYLGYKRGDEEGTVMALAAYGDPRRYRDLMTDAIRLVDGGIVVNPEYFLPRTLLPGAERLSERFREETQEVSGTDLASQERADLAAALQERVELAVVHLARLACSRVGTDRLTVAGGVAMNCVAMGRLAELEEVKHLWVPPAPGDAGTALGAALLSAEVGLIPAASSFALGPSCSEADLWVARGQLKPHVATSSPVTASKVAELLARGDIVAICQGEVEFGPRALGHRSILANPLCDSVTALLNSRVKHREAFRPYAPAILRSLADDWFELHVDSPYMSVASRAKPITQNMIPEVVHRNGRCRVQTVDASTSPFFSAILEEFFRITGVPILINTSLNVKGKPMSGTASMAVDCFLAGSIDALCLGERLYERR